MSKVDEEMKKAIEVSTLTNRKGWKHIKDFIKSNIRPIEDKLFNESLEKEEFDVLQAKRQAYEKVLNFVKRKVKKVENN
ncbi:MAG: hypothetical protein ACLFNL_08330 [Bacteroidales bacterium]